MTIFLHQGDLPDGLDFGAAVAVDTEAMGLDPHRDRLCLVQVSAGDGDAHLVQFKNRDYAAPQLRALLTDPSVEKIFHYARFDVAILKYYMGIECAPVYCTKIASKLCRTYTDRHGLRELCREVLGVELNKQQQASDWGAGALSDEQQAYAANDVLYLHRLREALAVRVAREGRTAMAESCFRFLPTRCALDLAGWGQSDIFAH